MIIHKRTCSECKEEKLACDFLKRGTRCCECTYKYQKAIRDKNPLLQWGRRNQDDKFTIKKTDAYQEVLRIESE